MDGKNTVPLKGLLQIPAIFSFAARPRSGKSHMIKHLVRHLGFKGGWVICPTAFNGDYNFIPEKARFPRYDPKLISQIEEVQKGDPKPRFLIIDDCLGDIRPDDPTINALFSRYRHYNLSVFIGTQYIRKISPTMRTCTTYFFIWPQTTKKDILKLHEDVASGYDAVADPAVFLAKLKGLGQYEAMLLDSRNMEVFSYKVGS